MSSIQPPFALPQYPAILYYDYILTFSIEIERFWTRLSWASCFFFMNRYLVLLGHIPTIWQYFWSSSDIAYNQRVSNRRLFFRAYHVEVPENIFELHRCKLGIIGTAMFEDVHLFGQRLLPDAIPFLLITNTFLLSFKQLQVVSHCLNQSSQIITLTLWS
jgi:hypothetical protein